MLFYNNTAAPGNGRILGGEDASEGQFPYIVSIRYQTRHLCGGAILDDSTILAAANCVDKASPSALTIRVGSTKLSEQTEEYAVTDYVRHENYDPKNLKNDISIIKLATPIQLRDGVEAIALRQTNIGEEDVVVSGWGSTEHPGIKSDDLQFINLQTITPEDCIDELPYPVGATEICTLGKEGEGTCNGDAGGPMVDSNGELAGIAAWGIPCGLGYPDVYTRVFSFLKWIEEHR